MKKIFIFSIMLFSTPVFSMNFFKTICYCCCFDDAILEKPAVKNSTVYGSTSLPELNLVSSNVATTLSNRYPDENPSPSLDGFSVTQKQASNCLPDRFKADGYYSENSLDSHN